MNKKISVIIFKNHNNNITIKLIKSPQPQELPMPPMHWLKT